MTPTGAEIQIRDGLTFTHMPHQHTDHGTVRVLSDRGGYVTFEVVSTGERHTDERDAFDECIESQTIGASAESLTGGEPSP